MTPLQAKTKEVVDLCLQEDYYVEELNRTMAKVGVEPTGLATGQYEDRQCIMLMHYFWETLPDTRAIRRYPFSQVCEIAEHIFD